MLRTLAGLLASFGLVCGACAAPSKTGQKPTFTPTSPTSWTTIYADVPGLDLDVWEPAGGGSVAVKQNNTVTFPSGSKATVTATRTVSAATVKAGVKAAARGLVPGFAVAEFIWTIWNDIGIEQHPSMGPVIDPGAPQVMKGGRMNDFRTGQPMTPGAILAREASTICVGQAGGEANLTCEVTQANAGCSNGTCFWTIGATVRYQNGTIAWTLPGGDSGPDIQAPGCSLETPGAKPPLGDGGPCPTLDRVPAPDVVFDDWYDNAPPEVQRDTAEDVGKGTPGGFPTEDVPTLFGPPSVQDPPEIVTKPDGSTIERSRQWDVEYGPGPNITATPRLVEVDSQGGTTTTEGGAAAGGADNRTDCDKYPDSIGCAKFGTPDSGQVTKNSKSINFEPVDLAGGSCPADREFVAFGTSYAISWEPICDATVNYVRPVVLLIFGGMAAFVFIGGLKS